MTRLAWIAAAIVLFIGTVLVQLPAALLALALPDDAPLALEDVRGTVWRGRVMQVRWRDRPLGSLAWTTRPGALLLGRFDARLRLDGDANARARVLRGLRRTRIQDLDAAFPVDWLQDLMPGATTQARGQLRLSVASATIERDRFTALAGEMAWHDAALRGVSGAHLGTLRARFALGDDHCVHGTVRDAGGPLSASGGFATDFASYRVDLRLGARDPRIAPALRWLGQADAEGRRVLHLQRGSSTEHCHAMAPPNP